MSKLRYVVVDLNAIEEGLNHYIRNEDHVVLPHMIMSDLAGVKENKRINKHINCLPGWLRARGNQVWLAHDWVTLEKLESLPDIRIDDLGWLDNEGSKALRPGRDATPKQWFESFRDFESSIGRQTVEDGRKAFFYACEQIGNGMMTNDPDLVSQVKSSQCWRTEVARLIRKPIMGHVLGLMDPKYRTQEWNDALERFPDEMAIGRMSRIMCWYSILQGAGIRKVQRNDFEDTAYAHAASYTGYLATEDGHLSDMVRAVFENVTIISKQP
jgi:hypothetical protein